jgi:hypothetical protein
MPKFFDQILSINWMSQWDLLLVRLIQSSVVLLYRSNFNWLMEEKYGATADLIGHITSFQVHI